MPGKRCINVGVLFFSLILGGCFSSDLKIIQPLDGGSYVGIEGVPESQPPIDSGTDLPAQIRIQYDSQPSTLRVYMNGSDVSDYLVIGAQQATIATVDIEHFLKQGRNRLLVNPSSFGPTHVFTFDSKGPEVVISQAQTQADGSINVSGYLRDSANVQSLTLDTYLYVYDGVQQDGSVIRDSDTLPDPQGNPRGSVDNSAGIQDSDSVTFDATNEFTLNVMRAAERNDLYRFTATDEYGYTSVVEYLADGQLINPMFKLRVGDSLLQEIIPVANTYGDDVYLYDKGGLEARGYDARIAELESEGALDNFILASIRENHSAIYTDTGAAHDEASDCHETPLQFTCTAAQYINNDGGGIGGDANTARGPDRDQNGDHWYCTEWSWTPSPDAQRQSDGGQACSYIEVYSLKSEDVTIDTLNLYQGANSELNLSVTLTDSDDPADGEGLDARLGIFDWQCGPLNVPYGEYDGNFFDGDLCDDVTTSSCNNLYGVRLTEADRTKTEAEVLAAVTPQDWCTRNGATVAAGIASLGDVTVKDDGINPNGQVSAIINDSELSIALNNFSFGFNNPSIDASGTEIGWLAGALDSVFVDITESVLQNSLTDFDLEFLLTQGEIGTSFSVMAQAWQVNSFCTSVVDGQEYLCGNQPNPDDASQVSAIDWQWLYRAGVKVNVADANAVESLGSLYQDSEVGKPLDDLQTDLDNLSLNLNNNLINQALNAAYSVGVTHISVLMKQPSKIYYGAQATETLGAEGEHRIVMAPSAPPVFTIQRGLTQGVEALITYNGVAMQVDKKEQAGWSNVMTLDVDIEAGVTLVSDQQRLVVDLLGTPRITVNRINLPSPFNGFNALASSVVETVSSLVIPLVIRSGLTIDPRNLYLADAPDRTATQADVDSGKAMAIGDPIAQQLQLSIQQVAVDGDTHLGMSMGLNSVDAQ